MTLPVLWFGIIAFLFIGYFVLDGFDFGAGMALPLVSRDDVDRRVVINAIGPVWDLNETWLIVAGASIFAAFPDWYATLFSGFYLPLLLILLALIVRGVSFEYRHHETSTRWRRAFDRMIVVGSIVPALLWGVAFADIVRGVPLDAHHTYTGTFFDLLNPYALLGGVTTLLLFLTHGAVFLTIKTEGDVRIRARRLALGSGVATVVAAASFLLWTGLVHGNAVYWLLAAAAAVVLIGSVLANLFGFERRAFALTALTVLFAVASLFAALAPDVMPASNDPANSLTIANASSTPYTLTVMSWTALIFLPVVLAYQAWSYWVFRKRIGRAAITGGAGDLGGTPAPAQRKISRASRAA
jgi:cytochrome d ubiquinol oxidase subunit II